MASDSDPSIEVVIAATTDKLSGGLKVAEGMVAKSAAVMGEAGAKAGGLFNNALVRRLAGLGSSLAVLNAGLRSGVEAMKAGESGAGIGEAMLEGVVAGAKSLPIIGSLVEIIDFQITGAAEEAAKRAADAGRRVAAQVDEIAAAQTKRGEATGTLEDLTKDVEARADPEADATRASEKELEALFQKHQAAQAANEEAYQLAIAAQNASDKEKASAEKNKARQSLKNEDLYLRAKHALNVEIEKKLSDLYNEGVKKREEVAAKQAEEVKKKAEKAASDAAKALKTRQDLAIREMTDRLEALQEVSAPTHGERLGELADKAAAPLIRSGQTALGQFTFAGGNADQAIRNAEEQLAKLEAIESLQREMRDYQRKIAEGIAA